MLKKIIENCKKEMTGVLSLPIIGPVAITAMAHILSANRLPIVQWIKRQSQDIATEHGVSWQDVFLAQYIYDFSQITGNGHASACTTGSVRDSNGRVLFVRFMDWDYPAGIGKFTDVQSVNGFTSVGFPGMLGVITAMGTGWAMALNQAPSGGAYNLFGVPVCIYGRKLAAEINLVINHLNGQLSDVIPAICRTLKEKGIEPMTSCMFHIATTKQHAIVEFVPGRPAIFTFDSIQKPVALSNHFLSHQNKDLNGPAEWTADGIDWVDDTEDRRDAMLGLLRGVKKIPRLMDIISRTNKPIKNESTANVTVSDLFSGESVTMSM